MIDVQVTIDGIVLYCDETVSALQLGNGYSIKKEYLEEIKFKNKITSGDGRLTINYMGSQLNDDRGIYFMCIHKNDTHQIQAFQSLQGITVTNPNLMYENQLEIYKDLEMKYLDQKFSLLHLFKKGNIGCKETFLEHKFTVMGFINNTQKQTNDIVTRNIVDNRMFSLTPEEVSECNQFLQDYNGREYDLIKNCIDEFIWGLEQVDIPTGFEQYTTALEMIFLDTKQQGKKEILSKRVAVLLENDPNKIRILYNKMKSFYRYRSESLHEGNGTNITVTELKELEEIVRKVLVKYLYFCKLAIQNNVDSTWIEVKKDRIDRLKSLVNILKTKKILPV